MHTCLPQGRGIWPQASSKQPCSVQLLHATLVALGILAIVVDGIFVRIMLEPRPPARTEHEVSVFLGRRPGPGAEAVRARRPVRAVRRCRWRRDRPGKVPASAILQVGLNQLSETLAARNTWLVRIFLLTLENGFTYSQTISPAGVTSKKRPFAPSQIRNA